MTILDLINRNARDFPGEIALVELKPSTGYRRVIDWADFKKRIDRLASALIERGAEPGKRVIHLMMNSIDWLIVYFAILKTGAWAVPLNFRFTSGDIKYCADIAAAGIMVLGEEFRERIENIRPELRAVNSYIFAGSNPPPGMEILAELIDSTLPGNISFKPQAHDVGGLYFTSGTTGEPKPIVLTHRNLLHAAITEQKHHHQTKRDNFICCRRFITPAQNALVWQPA
jgi:acyl-CoA synthetase (AMP-forming)/AMP-acid ligase II